MGFGDDGSTLVGHAAGGWEGGSPLFPILGDPMLVSPQIRITTEDRHPELNASQRQAVDQVLLSREKIVGLDGVAGAGKTSAL
jgi:hypothetical protein